MKFVVCLVGEFGMLFDWVFDAFGMILMLRVRFGVDLVCVEDFV